MNNYCFIQKSVIPLPYKIETQIVMKANKISLAVSYDTLMYVLSYGRTPDQSYYQHPNYNQRIKTILGRYNAIELEDLVVKCRIRINQNNNK